MAEQKIQLINAISFAKGTTEPSNREVWWIDDNITGNVYNKLKYFNVDSGSWELVQRTAAQLLLDLKTVDGAGSGLDADTLDGYTAAELLQGEIKLSSGEILVGQLNDQAAAKTLSGIATIDINGALSYVANSISHTGLTDIGSNTHAQIDSHISSTANPHGVTAAQVGNTTAQWNANSIEGNLTNVGVLGAGQDGQALVWDNATSRFITAAVSSPSIYTSNDTIGSGRVATITDTLTFDLGTTATLLQRGIKLDADSIYYTSGSSLPIFEATNNNGQIFNVTASGFLQTYSDLGGTIARLYKRGGTQGLSLGANTTTLAVEIFKIQNTFAGSNDYFTFEVDPTFSQMYMATGGTFEHWLRTGTSAQATFFRNGINGSGFNVGGTGPIGSEKISLQGSTLVNDKFEIQSTTSGFLMPRMTTAQMNAIAAPDTHLLIFNTDLNAIYRYNGAAWVALSAGYGIIEVIRDSDAGIPTFYADLQTALETCKASGGNNVVKLHSDISLSAQIDINSAGTGTGNAYQFNSLLIDGNGFEISFDDAGSTNTFDINLTHTCNISIVNTTIKRTSGTGTHYAFDIDGNDFQTISMANNYFYSDNGGAAFIRDITGKMFDLGGTRFESDGSINTLTFRSYSMYYRNFSTVSNGSGAALFNWSDGDITNFTTENTSTGKAYDSNANAKASFFTAKSNSGVAVDANISSCVVTNFKAESTSGNAFLGFNATNFYLKTGNAVCLSAGAYANLKNGYVENNSTSSTMDTNTIEYCHNVTFVNYGSGYAADLNNTVSFNNKITNCTFISEGGIGAFLDTVGVEVYNCTFISRYNNAAGHACELDVSGCRLLGCVFIVENASANGLYSNTALNADVANCSFDNATTPINANITVNASTDLGNGNRQY